MAFAERVGIAFRSGGGVVRTGGGWPEIPLPHSDGSRGSTERLMVAFRSPGGAGRYRLGELASEGPPLAPSLPFGSATAAVIRAEHTLSLALYEQLRAQECEAMGPEVIPSPPL